jgi:DNA-binding CsgD family transcriptional regulator
MSGKSMTASESTFSFNAGEELRSPFQDTLLSKLVASYVAELGDVLTGRELEIAELLIRGYSAKEIAQSIAVSPGTVRTHMKNLYPKLDVTSQARLCARFYEFVFSARGRGSADPEVALRQAHTA